MVATEKIQSKYSTKVLNHLGLVSGMCQDLRISELINGYIPNDSPDKILSTGDAVVGLILNGLGFVNKRLYLVSKFFENKPVGKLLNNSYLKSEHFNDDALGRSLDAIYDYGVSKLYSQLSSQVVQYLSQTYGLEVGSGQLDNTTFHLHGCAKTIEEESETVLEITRGYSKDYRPDLVQIGLQLIVDSQSGIPLLMEVLSGNQEEAKSYGAFVKKYASQLDVNFNMNTIIGDSKLYNQENLGTLGGESYLNWITRVPNSLKVLKDVLTHLSPETLTPLEGFEKYKYQEVCSVYGDVKQRWIILQSEDKYAQDLKRLDKKRIKATEAAQKAYKKLTKQLFLTEKEAKNAAEKLSKSLLFNKLEEVEVFAKNQYSKPGKPRKDQQPDKICYRIEGKICTNEENYEAENKKLGYFVLATNVLEPQTMNASQILTQYKNQSKVESSFRFLKDPKIVASSLFVQKPERMVALMMIMTLCLLVYSALEYVTRTLLKEKGVTFPNQINKEVQNPTMRWIFECFEGIHVLYLTDNQEVVLNLKEEHHRIIQLLGNNYLSLYT